MNTTTTTTTAAAKMKQHSLHGRAGYDDCHYSAHVLYPAGLPSYSRLIHHSSHHPGSCRSYHPRTERWCCMRTCFRCNQLLYGCHRKFSFRCRTFLTLIHLAPFIVCIVARVLEGWITGLIFAALYKSPAKENFPITLLHWHARY